MLVALYFHRRDMTFEPFLGDSIPGARHEDPLAARLRLAHCQTVPSKPRKALRDDARPFFGGSDAVGCRLFVPPCLEEVVTFAIPFVTRDEVTENREGHLIDWKFKQV